MCKYVVLKLWHVCHWLFNQYKSLCATWLVPVHFIVFSGPTNLVISEHSEPPFGHIHKFWLSTRLLVSCWRYVTWRSPAKDNLVLAKSFWCASPAVAVPFYLSWIQMLRLNMSSHGDTTFDCHTWKISR